MPSLPVLDFESFRQLCLQIANEQYPQLVKSRPVWIFGAGQFGRDVCSALNSEGFCVHGFIESKPVHHEVLNLPVLSWEQLTPEHVTAQIVIGIFNRSMPLDELQEIAKSAGFAEVFMPWDVYNQFHKQLGWRYWLSTPELILKNLVEIKKAYDCLSDDNSRKCFLEILTFRLGQHLQYSSFAHPDRQYFNDLTLGAIGKREITFLDGGAYNGDTLMELATTVKVSNAFLFEPDPDNFRQLTVALKKSLLSAVCLPLAISNQHHILSFNAGSGEAGSISASGTTHIAAVALDDMLAGHQVDFIKLDIEGEEVAALHGAKKLIKRSCPILAISLYHRPEDIWKIPCLVVDIFNSYDIFIKQHYFNSFDSVLYAIPRQ